VGIIGRAVQQPNIVVVDRNILQVKREKSRLPTGIRCILSIEHELESQVRRQLLVLCSQPIEKVPRPSAY